MTDLLNRQGPLAQVWLAANYDKKLTRQQLLNADIIQGSNLVCLSFLQQNADQSVSHATKALRLSGHLMLGLAKIYSRKAKYLVEDSNDVLLRLNNSFFYGNGEKLSRVFNRSSNDTVTSNLVVDLRTITMQDQITEQELLYQEDLELDPTPVQPHFFFGESQMSTHLEDSMDFDNSIEVGRNIAHDELDKDAGADIELDFDLGSEELGISPDVSIEQGRDAIQTQYRPEFSLLEGLEHEQSILNIEFPEDIPRLPVEPEEVTQQVVPSRKRPNSSVKSVAVRKLVVDDDRSKHGISIQTLKENQKRILNWDARSFEVDDVQMLKIVQELAAFPLKRRRISRTPLIPVFDRVEENRLLLDEQHELQFNDDYDDYHGDLSLDLTLPALHSDDLVTDNLLPQEPGTSGITVRSTNQVIDNLKYLFEDSEVLQLSEIISSDLRINERKDDALPLGLTSKVSERQINMRSEAAKCFFEVLVLANQDYLSISQEADITNVRKYLEINKKEKFNAFL